MKSAFRYFLFLWIITASINNVNAENLTFMVGDDAGVGNKDGNIRQYETIVSRKKLF